ncbi:TPA: aminopeptidase P family protein [Neisseria weaveri]
MSTVVERIRTLRETMQQHRIDAWIIPTADPHLSEYLPEHWQSRVYFSGFTGSAGTLVVTAKQAGLWADSRYWEQAAQQLSGSGITLQKLGAVPNYTEWLSQHLPEQAVVGIAPDMLSLNAKQQLLSAFADRHILLQHDQDIAANVWPQRPTLPSSTIFVHNPEYVAESAAAKLNRIRSFMHQQGVAHHLVSSLDDIAWITNLRGSDVSYNPVFLSFLLISHNRATLFLVDQQQLNEEARQLLAEAQIDTADYQDAAAALAQLSGGLMIDPARTAVSTLQYLPKDLKTVEHINPSTLFKSIKSSADLAHIRTTMAQDGAALCGFFAEFERKIAAGEAVTELDVDTMLLAHRSRRNGFVSPSFGTIAGFNQNGALPHYSATPEAHSIITGNGLLLIDSGGQYHGGTTDITRVIPIGTPSEEQKRDFTLVLKAHIALATTIFPENIPGPMLDAICRKPLWQAQCNYGHGTGHGVGYFLNVHEGPQTIAYMAPVNPNHAMKAGMITSNEPGLYRPGKWGIRIENLVANVPVDSPAETEFGNYLRFETLTLCPIDTRLIEKTLLTAEETNWLNSYHAEVREKLLPLVEGEAKAWLEAQTQSI